MSEELAPTVLRAVRQASSPSPSNRPTVLRAARVRGSVSDVAPAEDTLAVGAPRAVGTSSPTELLAIDPELAAYVRQANTAAVDAARLEGLEQGRAEQAARIQQLENAVAIAVNSLRQLTEQHRDVFANDVVELAQTIAETVIDRTPHDGGAALLDRLRHELAEAGPIPVVVRVHPDDVPAVAAATNAELVTVEVDPRLSPGDVSLETEWSTVERTRSAAWELVRAAIDDE